MSRELTQSFSVRKFDATRDLSGGFLPTNGLNTFDCILERIQHVLTWMDLEHNLKLYNQRNINDPVVKRGTNNLDTCY